MFAPVNYGFLRRSVGYKIDGMMSALIWAGGAGSGINVKYAPYVEFGTGTRVNVPGDVKDYAIQFKERVKESKQQHNLISPPQVEYERDVCETKTINLIKKSV